MTFPTLYCIYRVMWLLTFRFIVCMYDVADKACNGKCMLGKRDVCVPIPLMISRVPVHKGVACYHDVRPQTESLFSAALILETYKTFLLTRKNMALENRFLNPPFPPNHDSLCPGARSRPYRYQEKPRPLYCWCTDQRAETDWGPDPGLRAKLTTVCVSLESSHTWFTCDGAPWLCSYTGFHDCCFGCVFTSL